MLCIQPIKGSVNWKYSIVIDDGVDKDWKVKRIHVKDIRDFPENKEIYYINLSEGYWHKIWHTITPVFARNEFMPVVIGKLSKEARISFHGYDTPIYFSEATWHLREECAKIAEIVFDALKMFNCSIKPVRIGYYGSFSEDFVRRQIEHHNFEPLHLVGPWPNGAINLIKLYIELNDHPHISLTPHNKVSVSRKFFDSLFAKFLEVKLTMRFMHGNLEFDLDYLNNLRPELHVQMEKDEGKNIMTWKSPIDCRDFFQVEFLEDEVVISNHYMGICLCKGRRKLPHILKTEPGVLV